MKDVSSFLIALAVLIVQVTCSMAVTTQGSIGDGRTSLAYFTDTGEMVVQPDGVFVGLFDIVSASGIFTADANLPANALVTINTQSRKSWSALNSFAFDTDFSLGLISPPGLSLDFLLNDLTVFASGGFGTPTRDLDLVYTIPEPATAALGGLSLFVLVGSRRRRD
jgi:hypothetical protein